MLSLNLLDSFYSFQAWNCLKAPCFQAFISKKEASLNSNRIRKIESLNCRTLENICWDIWTRLLQREFYSCCKRLNERTPNSGLKTKTWVSEKSTPPLHPDYTSMHEFTEQVPAPGSGYNNLILLGQLECRGVIYDVYLSSLFSLPLLFL